MQDNQRSVSSRLYLITSVSDHRPLFSGRDMLHGLLESGWYVFADSTAGRKDLKPGDRLVFYYARAGVIAEAEVASKAERRRVRNVEYPFKYEWSFKVKGVRFFEKPLLINSEIRSRLDAFKGKDPSAPWAWFVQMTHYLTEHDFLLLTGRSAGVVGKTSVNFTN